MAERLIRMSMGFFIGVLTARILAPESFGVLSWAISLVSIFTPFLTQGLESLVPRDMIREPQFRASFLGAALAIKFIGILVVLISVPVAGLLLRPNDFTGFTVLLIVLGGQVFQGLDVFEYGFITRDDRRTPAIVRTSILLATSCVKVLILITVPDIRLIAIAIGAETVFPYLIIMLLERQSGTRLVEFHGVIVRIRKIWKECAWALASAVATMIFLRIDQIVVEALMGAKALGIYAAAVKVSEVTYFAPVAITAAAYPRLIRANLDGVELFEKEYRRVAMKTSLLCICISLISSFTGAWAFPILYGPKYASGATVLLIYAWSLVPIGINQCVGKWLVIRGKIHLLAVFQIFGGAINVGLNFVLVPRIGLIGAALSTLCSYTFCCIVLPLAVPESRRAVRLALFPFVKG